MTWFITHKPAYAADFVELPKNLQKQASQAHAELKQDPVTPRGDTIKPLKGWTSCGATGWATIASSCHPSSDPTPSPEDVKVTKLVNEAAKLLGIDPVDHIIVGKDQWVSLKQQGWGF